MGYREEEEVGLEATGSCYLRPWKAGWALPELSKIPLENFKQRSSMQCALMYFLWCVEKGRGILKTMMNILYPNDT